MAGFECPPRRGTVASEDTVNFLDRDGDAFHRRGGSDGLGLKVTAEPTSPRAGNRPPVVQLRFPAVQFPSQVENRFGVVR